MSAVPHRLHIERVVLDGLALTDAQRNELSALIAEAARRHLEAGLSTDPATGAAPLNWHPGHGTAALAEGLGREVARQTRTRLPARS